MWEKVIEELNEFQTAIKNKDFANAEDELGNLIFTLVNVARWLNLNIEEGLSNTNQRFLKRFAFIEEALEGNITQSSKHELNKLWDEAKKITPDKINYKDIK